MTLSNDEFAALALGLGLGLGATLISPAFGIGMGAGMVAILYATQQIANRLGEPEDDDCVESDDVATDGGTVRRETPQTAATEHPTKVCIDLFSGLGGFSAAFADAVETRQPTLFESATDDGQASLQEVDQ